ncbi:merozoite surface protein, putative [Plasmodium sp. gorilla clade G2]|uniref:merozoite surface protein, putative n=1 Tax=Plasmodium sp. gorilla clade G2 TaxID=880535 RepID=UPI000D269720|nr:merozoite surface protein, putative [Plasmodium sp. gorilla clade G2]SOV20197.1 merozoite surface protein, putative [Plasmodium sp. gorilla clade G2]
MNKFLNIIFYIFLILNLSLFQSNTISKKIKKEKQKNVRNGSSINDKNIENKNDNIKTQLQTSDSIEKQNDILNMYNNEGEKNSNNLLKTNVTKNTIIDNSDDVQESADNNVYYNGISVDTENKLKDTQPTTDNYKNERYQLEDEKLKYGGLFGSFTSGIVNFLKSSSSNKKEKSEGTVVSPSIGSSDDRSEPSNTSPPGNVSQDVEQGRPSRPQAPIANNRNENNQNGDPLNRFFAWEFGGGAPTYKPNDNKKDKAFLEHIKITSWEKEDIIKENEDTKPEIQENEAIEDNFDMEEENEIVDDQLQENENDEDDVNLEDIEKNTRNDIFEEQMKLDSAQDEKAHRLIYEEYKKKAEGKNSLEDHVNILVNLLQTNNQLDPSLKDLAKELIVFLNNY